MPKLAKDDTSQVNDTPVSADHGADLEGYNITFVTLKADADLTPLLLGLPNNECTCPHWGYVFKGRMWWRFGDREEVYGAGDAFYAPAGHTTGGDAGSEFLIISPSDELSVVHEHMGRRAQELTGA